MNIKYTLMKPAIDAAGNFEADDNITAQVEYNSGKNWFDFRIMKSDGPGSAETMAEFLFSSNNYCDKEIMLLSKKIAGIYNDIHNLNTAQAIISLLPMKDAKAYVDINEFLNYFLTEEQIGRFRQEREKEKSGE